MRYNTIKNLLLVFVVGVIIFNMGLFTWGSLPKAQDDEKTIDEAIASAIQAHEQDPTSHMGVGESIDEHRKNEVVDHPAYSVLDDKLAYDRNFFDITFANLSNFDTSSDVELSGLDTALMFSSNSSDWSWLIGQAGDMIPSSYFNYSKNPRFVSSFLLQSVGSLYATIGLGNDDEAEGFGFMIDGNTLIGFYYDTNGDIDGNELCTIIAGKVYKIEARVFYPDKIEFWVNNELLYTTPNPAVPASNSYKWNIPEIFFRSQTTTTKELDVRGFYWEADL